MSTGIRNIIRIKPVSHGRWQVVFTRHKKQMVAEITNSGLVDTYNDTKNREDGRGYRKACQDIYNACMWSPTLKEQG